jgi:hypothetical protein
MLMMLSALAVKPAEHHDDDAAKRDANRDPAFGFVARGKHHGVVILELYE